MKRNWIFLGHEELAEVRELRSSRTTSFVVNQSPSSNQNAANSGLKLTW